METIQNQILTIMSNAHQSKITEKIVQVLTSLFECIKKENNDMISDIKYLREETNDLISDLMADISTVEKKVDSLSRD